MAFRTFGAMHYDKLTGSWIIDSVEPHVAIALKNIFRRIRPTATAPFTLKAELDICTDLYWFIQRYPLVLSDTDLRMLKKQDRSYRAMVEEREAIFSQPVTARVQPNVTLKNVTPYASQIQAAEFALHVKRYLLGDTQGLGKTISAILAMLYANVWPAAIVLDTQILYQWKAVIEKHTDLKVHIIKKRENYDLPQADVYLFKYSILQGWADYFATGAFQFVVFDEIASLRGGTETEKGNAAKVLADHAEYVMGLSGTPIYNYGGEIFTILHEFIKPGCLGTPSEFHREWCQPENNKIIKDPKALGAYLREIHVMLRRTKKEVLGIDNPPYIEVREVGYDPKESLSHEALLKRLAISTLGEDERNNAFQGAGEFSIRMRQITGLVKAKEVALYVRMLVESGEPVILTAWHREVYEVYLKELADLNPVMFTGSENPKEKEQNKQKFINGESNLIILSLRSGIGVDGLQERCAYMVFGELDYSPQVHSQLITRIDRPGQKREVTILFLVCMFGSDPVMQQLLGLKRSQSDGIMNPFSDSLQEVHTHGDGERSRIQMVAKDYLRQLEQGYAGANSVSHEECAA